MNSDRHGRQRQQAEPEVQPQQHADDAEQQHDVAHRHDRRLEEFLHRVDVALQARHQPADLGLVHEAQRHPLQVAEHGAAQVEQHVLGHLADDAFLHIAGGVVDEDGHREGADRPAEHRAVEPARHHAVVDGVADDQRDRQLRQREHQHRGDRDEDPALRYGLHEAPDAPDDARVVGLAEDLFLVGGASRRPPLPAACCVSSFSSSSFCGRHQAAPAAVGCSSSGRSCRS